jgi:hypothetical protein
MKKTSLILGLIFSCIMLLSCNNNSCKIQENNSISFSSSVKIGDQVWMSKNLDVNTFRNGDVIPEVKTNEDWYNASISKKPAWCYYNNDPSNGEKFGKLYNWYAINDSRGLAPIGWHIPSRSDWETLIDYLGGETVAGGYLKTKDGRKNKVGSIVESGFSGLLSGYRYIGSSFGHVGEVAFWWSASDYLSTYVWCCGVYYPYDIARLSNDCVKGAGLSVRCIQD